MCYYVLAMLAHEVAHILPTMAARDARGSASWSPLPPGRRLKRVGRPPVTAAGSLGPLDHVDFPAAAAARPMPRPLPLQHGSEMECVGVERLVRRMGACLVRCEAHLRTSHRRILALLCRRMMALLCRRILALLCRRILPLLCRRIRAFLRRPAARSMHEASPISHFAASFATSQSCLPTACRGQPTAESLVGASRPSCAIVASTSHTRRESHRCVDLPHDESEPFARQHRLMTGQA